MTTTSTHRNCIDCGASFARSRTDATIRCIDCRGTRRTTKAATYKAVACGRCGHEHTTLRCDRCGF